MSMYGSMRSRAYWGPTDGSSVDRTVAEQIKRGDIYWVKIPYNTGSEMCKDRPGIIVSSDRRNAFSNTVTVVMLSKSSQRDMPEHVTVQTGGKSTALCEHIYTVDKSRLGTYAGRLSKQEMDAINEAIMVGMDLKGPKTEGRAVECGVIPTAKEAPTDAIMRLEVERNTYKALYEGLLDRMSMERRVGA